MIKDILHLKSPGNWMNDPNGFIYYHGKYHLFYQHFPYTAAWGTMHWGHAVSEDLIHWEHQKIALFPSKNFDRNGVFSGSAVEQDGSLLLYYTGVRYIEENEENIHHSLNEKYESCQVMIRSKDGYEFDNWEGKKQIIPVIRDKKIADATHTRDPKVWKSGNNYYMILGSTLNEEVGRVLFYKSEDAENWTYVSQYQDENYGKILECPDLFPIGEDYVFIGSPMYIMEDGLEYANHAVCTFAKFTQEDCMLQLPREYRFVDYGLDLYAPQTNLDKEGRRVLIAWMRMPCGVCGKDREEWNGMMCLPRVVECRDGQIRFPVHPAVEDYFDKQLESVNHIDFTKPFRLKATMKEGETLDIGGYRIWVEENCVKADRSRVFASEESTVKYRMISSTPTVKEEIKLDLFVEPNLIEIFVNDGQYVLSNVVYHLGSTITGEIEQIFVSSEQ